MDRDMDESRKQFLEWWIQPEQEELRKSCAEGWAEKIWASSRDKTKIELPRPISMLVRFSFNSTYHSVNAIKFDDVKKAIRAAGIKVKE